MSYKKIILAGVPARAVQYRGHSSVLEIMALLKNDGEKTPRVFRTFGNELTASIPSGRITMYKSEWVVRSGTGKITVLTSKEFKRRNKEADE